MKNPMLLLGFLLVFYLFVFLIRSFLLWKNTGINPLTFDGSDDAHDFNSKVFKGITLLELFVVILNMFGEKARSYLLPFWYLDHPALSLIGWGFLLSSLIWVFLAQLQMGNSWRIGIDHQRQTELIQTGLFSISRNPIFLGILLANLGLFLVIPNAFTLLIAVLSFTTIQTQVRLEEEFLQKSKGLVYLKYKNSVRRWL